MPQETLSTQTIRFAPFIDRIMFLGMRWSVVNHVSRRIYSILAIPKDNITRYHLNRLWLFVRKESYEYSTLNFF